MDDVNANAPPLTPAFALFLENLTAYCPAVRATVGTDDEAALRTGLAPIFENGAYGALIGGDGARAEAIAAQIAAVERDLRGPANLNRPSFRFPERSPGFALALCAPDFQAGLRQYIGAGPRRGVRRFMTSRANVLHRTVAR